jgi:beta-N-acetylhexosaminidase
MFVSDRVEKLLAGMTLEQKIGQLLVYGFAGAHPHRDVLESIDKYHVSGFRVTPHGKKFVAYLSPDHPIYSRVCRPPEPTERVYHASIGEPRLTVAEYAETLNVVRKRSLETGAGIACTFEHDFEGNYNADTLDHTTVAFPHYMGLAAAGDPALCRRVGYITGLDLKTAGIDIVHGPVLDVNTNPANPEIETRSFSPDPAVVEACGLQYMLGCEEGGLAAMAKHFPGRGASSEDAHYSVPVITESLSRMNEVHLAPYRALIANGLSAIMLAHTVYPSLDASGQVSTLSKPIVTGLLREQLGFDGVVITDSFTMAGLVALYEVAEGTVRAIEAGVDQILMKDENSLRGEVFDALMTAVRTGRISEDRIHESVRRVLTMKERHGLLDPPYGIVDIERLHRIHADPELKAVAKEAAEKSLVVLRDDAKLLPLRKGSKVLVVEEPFGLMGEMNSSVAYCGALYHALLRAGVDAYYTDYHNNNLDAAWPDIQRLSKLVDVVVFTGYTKRGQACRRENYERFLQLGKPLVFVTNSPYPKIVSPKFSTVLVTFSTTAMSSQAAAEVILGSLTPTGKLAFDPTRVY